MSDKEEDQEETEQQETIQNVVSFMRILSPICSRCVTCTEFCDSLITFVFSYFWF